MDVWRTSGPRLLTIDVLPRAPACCRLRGEVDLACIEQLRNSLRLLAATGSPVVQVDLSGLDFMAVTGLNALVNARNELQAQGRELRLLRPPAHIDRMLRICGMADAIRPNLEIVRPIA